MDGEKKVFSPIYHIHGDMDIIVDERGSQFISLRKVQWGRSEPLIPDETKAKLELRRWNVNPEGEVPSKGVTFLTENGPHNCAVEFVKSGFGDTKEILLALKDREDFRKSVETLYDDSDMSDSNGEFFDARELLLNE